MSRGDEWDDEEPRERRRRPPPDEYEDDYDRGYDRGYAAERSGAVTGVAVISFVIGGLVLLLGLCGMIGVLAFAGEAGRQGIVGFPGIGGGIAIAMVVIIAIIAWGTGAIIAGIGVVNRRQWGRILTLVLGGFSALVGLLYLIAAIQVLATPMPPPAFGGPPGAGGAKAVTFLVTLLLALVFIGYTIWTYIVLLNSRYAAEFR
jgi:hypothetical protein